MSEIDNLIHTLYNDPTKVAWKNTIPVINPGAQGKTHLWFHGDNEDNFKKNCPERYKTIPVSYRLNTLGYRGDEFDLDKESVLCFGDSFTFGIGLAEEETWPYQLQNMSGHHCVNLGEGGSSNHQILRMMHQVITVFKPKACIALLSDMTRQEFYHGEGRVYLQKVLVNSEGGTDAERHVRKHFLQTYTNLDSFKRFVQYVQGMENVCDANNVPLFWTTWDTMINSIPTEIMNRYIDPARRMDHTLCFHDHARDNMHFGYESNRIFAEETYEHIRSRL